jgi:hypothetical protein
MTKHLRKLLRGVLGLLLIIIFSSPEFAQFLQKKESQI